MTPPRYCRAARLVGIPVDHVNPVDTVKVIDIGRQYWELLRVCSSGDIHVVEIVEGFAPVLEGCDDISCRY